MTYGGPVLNLFLLFALFILWFISYVIRVKRVDTKEREETKEETLKYTTSNLDGSRITVTGIHPHTKQSYIIKLPSAFTLKDVKEAAPIAPPVQEALCADTRTVTAKLTDIPKFEMAIYQEDQRIGRGFRISEKLFCTAFHCVKNVSEDLAGLYIAHPSSKQTISLKGSKIVFEDEFRDYALIEVSNQTWSVLGASVPKLSHIKTQMTTGRVKLFTFDDKYAGFSQSTPIKPDEALLKERMVVTHSCNTTKGDSGAPVYITLDTLL